MAAIASSSATRMWRVADGSGSGIIFPYSISAYRQRYGESGSLFQAFRNDPSSHGPDQAGADRQAKADALGCVLGGEERVKDSLGQFGRQTYAVVGNRYANLFGGTVGGDRDLDPSAQLRIVHPTHGDGVPRVAQQVDDHLLQAAGTA